MATVRRTSSGCSRPATTPTCGRPARLASEPPPKSRQYTWISSGVWVSASAQIRLRSAGGLAALRGADDRDMSGGAGHVDGQQAAGLVERLVHPAQRNLQERRGRDRSTGSAPRTDPRGSSRSSDGGSFSGGSHTSWAGTPDPASRDTATSSSVCARPVPAGSSSRAGAASPNSTRSHRRPAADPPVDASDGGRAPSAGVGGGRGGQPEGLRIHPAVIVGSGPRDPGPARTRRRP